MSSLSVHPQLVPLVTTITYQKYFHSEGRRDSSGDNHFDSVQLIEGEHESVELSATVVKTAIKEPDLAT